MMTFLLKGPDCVEALAKLVGGQEFVGLGIEQCAAGTLTVPLMRPGLPSAQPILQGRGIESSECI
jgi:hypothetical protein